MGKGSIHTPLEAARAPINRALSLIRNVQCTFIYDMRECTTCFVCASIGRVGAAWTGCMDGLNADPHRPHI